MNTVGVDKDLVAHHKFRVVFSSAIVVVLVGQEPELLRRRGHIATVVTIEELAELLYHICDKPLFTCSQVHRRRVDQRVVVFTSIRVLRLALLKAALEAVFCVVQHFKPQLVLALLLASCFRKIQVSYNEAIGCLMSLTAEPYLHVLYLI